MSHFTAGSVSQYSVAADGSLTALSPATAPAGPGPFGIAVSPDRGSVYVANNTAPGSVSQYSVSADGTLVPKLPATVSAARALSIVLSPDGRSAYVSANQTPGLVSQFDAAADGTLSPKSTPTVATGTNTAGVIAMNAAGTRAYVGSATAVSQFSIGADGSLSPLSPATVASGGSQPQGIALSPDGTSVYAANRASNTVSRFAVGADGTLTLGATVAAGGQANRITVSPDGASVYVANQQNSAVGQSISQYAVAADGSLTPKTPATVSTLPSMTPRIVVLSSDGASAYVPTTGTNDVALFAVGAGGTLTARSPASVPAGAGPTEAAYSDGPPAPATTTLSASASGTVAAGGQISASATLAGGTSPGGTITFRVYGPGDTSCATPLQSSTATATGNGTYASAPFTASSPGVYRWTAGYGGDGGNAAAGPTSCSDAATAVTVTDMPSATTGAASGVTAGGADLAGTVNPNGVQTFYTFEYGTSLSLGSISAVPSAGPGFADVPASASLSGLSAGTTYYYRLVATNARFGTVSSFRTTGGTPQAPAAVTLDATASTNTTADLAGQVNPHGQPTAFTFEYGASTSFGAISDVVALDDADATEPVSASLSGLSPDTTYYFRVVATNATGTTVGSVRSFTTGPSGAPIVATGAASAVTASTATLIGTIDAHGSQTAFAFEYGTTNAFGSLSAVDNAGSTNGAQVVSLPLTGLTPGTTYLYRLIATNAGGTTAGVVHSFTTPTGS